MPNERNSRNPCYFQWIYSNKTPQKQQCDITKTSNIVQKCSPSFNRILSFKFQWQITHRKRQKLNQHISNKFNHTSPLRHYSTPSQPSMRFNFRLLPSSLPPRIVSCTLPTRMKQKEVTKTPIETIPYTKISSQNTSFSSKLYTPQIQIKSFYLQIFEDEYIGYTFRLEKQVNFSFLLLLIFIFKQISNLNRQNTAKMNLFCWTSPIHKISVSLNPVN
jgi:hypothetical protein